MIPVRLGAVGYLNARPLVFGLDRSPRFDLRYDLPSECARLLHAGDIDVGLIPSIEYLRGDSYRIVSDLVIASAGPVSSVALFATRPMKDVRSIMMDTSSRTSVALVRVLCARLFKITPVIESHGPDLDAMLRRADAALVIGDIALLTDPETVLLTDPETVRLKPDTTDGKVPNTVRLKPDTTDGNVPNTVRLKPDTTDDNGDADVVRRPASARSALRPGRAGAEGVDGKPDAIVKIDLGEAWTSMTGLPFVWAFWAGRAGALGADDVAALRAARDAGVGQAEAIAREYFREAPQHREIGARYLRENIKYYLGGSERAGLELFYRYAAEIGVVPEDAAGRAPCFY